MTYDVGETNVCNFDSYVGELEREREPECAGERSLPQSGALETAIGGQRGG